MDQKQMSSLSVKIVSANIIDAKIVKTAVVAVLKFGFLKLKRWVTDQSMQSFLENEGWAFLKKIILIAVH